MSQLLDLEFSIQVSMSSWFGFIAFFHVCLSGIWYFLNPGNTFFSSMEKYEKCSLNLVIFRLSFIIIMDILAYH